MKQILFVVLTLWLSVIYTEAQESVSVNKTSLPIYYNAENPLNI